MTVKRMDNVGIVVEDIDSVMEFFIELGLRLEGRALVEGEWAGRITGLGTQRVEIAMMVTRQYEDLYRLCYIRGPEGILIGLAQQLEQRTARVDPVGR